MGIGNLVGTLISFLIFGLTNFFIPENIFLVYSPLILFGASNFYAGIIFNRKVDETLTFEDHIIKLEEIRKDSFVIPQVTDLTSQNESKVKSLNEIYLGISCSLFAL